MIGGVQPEISPLDPARIRAAADMLVRAFDDGPIMRYLMPREPVRARGMRRFFRAGITDALPFGEVWAATLGGAVVGAGVWLPPGGFPPSNARKIRQVATVVPAGLLAPASLVRSVRYQRPIERAHPHHADHWYLAILGVDPAHQGRGVGSQLLTEVLPRADASGLPVYLETDKERNLAFYARHRFELVDTLHPAADGPPTWTMWRDPVVP